MRHAVRRNAVRTAAVVALVAGGLVLTPVSPAHAVPSDARLCTFASVTQPLSKTPAGEFQTGVVDAGPVYANNPLATIDLTCTIQTGPAGATHNGTSNDCVSFTTTGLAVAVLRPSRFTCWWPVNTGMYVCTQAVIGSTTFYWDPYANGGTGAWSLSSAVACSIANIVAEVPPQVVIDTLIPLLDALDFLVCPLLAGIFPPEGDIPGVHDCPPYGNNPSPDAEDGQVTFHFGTDQRA